LRFRGIFHDIGKCSRISGYPTSTGVFIVIFGIGIIFLGLYVCIGGIVVDMCICISIVDHVLGFVYSRVPSIVVVDL